VRAQNRFLQQVMVAVGLVAILIGVPAATENVGLQAQIDRIDYAFIGGYWGQRDLPQFIYKTSLVMSDGIGGERIINASDNVHPDVFAPRTSRASFINVPFAGIHGKCKFFKSDDVRVSFVGKQSKTSESTSSNCFAFFFLHLEWKRTAAFENDKRWMNRNVERGSVSNVFNCERNRGTCPVSVETKRLATYLSIDNAHPCSLAGDQNFAIDPICFLCRLSVRVGGIGAGLGAVIASLASFAASAATRTLLCRKYPCNNPITINPLVA
jgi:hypothetical protein